MYFIVNKISDEKNNTTARCVVLFFLVFGGESESFLDWLEIQGNAHLVEAVHADALLVGGQ